MIEVIKTTVLASALLPSLIVAAGPFRSKGWEGL